MARRSTTAILALVLATCCLESRAHAGGPLTEDGTPIGTSSYAIDLLQTAVLSGSRVTGLAGAYVAVAEDVDGDLQNPAAPAVRPFFSFDYFDYWLGLGLTFPALLDGVDFFNTGRETKLNNPPDSLLFATPAMNLQWGSFGLGATLEVQTYSLEPASGQGEQIDSQITTLHLQGANAFLDDQLIVGLGTRIVNMNVVTSSVSTDALFTTSAAGFEVGVLLKPTSSPFRIGAAFRSSVETQPSFSKELLPDDNGDVVLNLAESGRFFLPESVRVPWDLNLGVAVQFGRRPLNPPRVEPRELAERKLLVLRLAHLRERDELTVRLRDAGVSSSQIAAQLDILAERFEEERERLLEQARWQLKQQFALMPRQYLLVSASVVIAGSVESAVSVPSFVAQEVLRSGESAVYSPRLGVESEVSPDVLRLRIGSYLEPTRVKTSAARLHGTLGADLQVFRWNAFGLWPDDYLWRFGAALDVGPRYLAWGISLGGWYPRHSGKIAQAIDGAFGVESP